MVAEAEEAQPLSRVDELVERARAEEWDAQRLFVYLELDDASQCQNFGDRSFLRERHERWREAVELLDLIDPDRLTRWLLGRTEPPQIVQDEMNLQLYCMLGDLVNAARYDTYDVRLFININAHYGGRVRSPLQLAELIEERSISQNRALTPLRRSIFRDIGTQGFIWYQKFRFEGRPFNRVTEEAAELCGIAAGQTWKPDNPTHQRCWHNTLSHEQREREILQASAAPGVSRHHWGTDVDILGLNPNHFAEGGHFFEDWRWLDAHALDYGFFQPYSGGEHDGPAHMEERWHWSYYPIGQALWDYVRSNPGRMEEALFERWDFLDVRWGRGHGPYFGYMRQAWQSYLFNIDVPNISDQRSVESIEISGP